jgi:glycine cleavage system transcriptional repressor
MYELAITAIGADRPGVVAAVTGVLADLEGNLEDSSMTILGGRFAMVLIVAVPDSLTADEVRAALDTPAAELGLDVSVHPSDPAGPSREGEPWSVTVYGADRPGIVNRIARVLAESDVNIADLTTRVIGTPDRPVYAMLLDVVLPDGVDASGLQSELDAVAAELGVECSMHPADVDIL